MQNHRALSCGRTMCPRHWGTVLISGLFLCAQLAMFTVLHQSLGYLQYPFRHLLDVPSLSPSCLIFYSFKHEAHTPLTTLAQEHRREALCSLWPLTWAVLLFLVWPWWMDRANNVRKTCQFFHRLKELVLRLGCSVLHELVHLCTLFFLSCYLDCK